MKIYSCISLPKAHNSAIQLSFKYCNMEIHESFYLDKSHVLPVFPPSFTGTSHSILPNYKSAGSYDKFSFKTGLSDV